MAPTEDKHMAIKYVPKMGGMKPGGSKMSGGMDKKMGGKMGKGGK